MVPTGSTRCSRGPGTARRGWLGDNGCSQPPDVLPGRVMALGAAVAAWGLRLSREDGVGEDGEDGAERWLWNLGDSQRCAGGLRVCSLSWEDGEDREKAAEEWLWHSNVVFGDWETTGYSSHSWGPAPSPGSDLGTWQMLLNTLIP